MFGRFSLSPPAERRIRLPLRGQRLELDFGLGATAAHGVGIAVVGFLVWGVPINSAETAGIESAPRWGPFKADMMSREALWQVRGFTDCLGDTARNSSLRQRRASESCTSHDTGFHLEAMGTWERRQVQLGERKLGLRIRRGRSASTVPAGRGPHRSTGSSRITSRSSAPSTKSGSRDVTDIGARSSPTWWTGISPAAS